MFQYLVDENDFIPSKKIDETGLEALNSNIRRKMLETLSNSKKTVSELVDDLDLDRQTAYYHVQKLEKSGIIEREGSKPAYFSADKSGYYYQPGYVDPEENPVVMGEVPEILDGFVSKRQINAKIVVGAPFSHGEYNKRHRTSYQAGEICAMLGNFGKVRDQLVYTDTDIVREDNLEKTPLISVAGPRANTLSADLNDSMDTRFGEGHETIITPDNVYSDGNMGFIYRKEGENAPRIVLAGLHGIGTSAAIKAMAERSFELGARGAVVKGFGTKYDIEDIKIVEKLD